MQLFALASALLLLNTATAHAQAAQVDRIEFTEYGIYTVDRVIQEKDAAGINKASASNVRHAATLRTVPAQIGTTFGFRYRLAGTPNGTPVNLREIVIFPPTGLFPKESSSPIVQDEFTLQSRIGEINYAAYTLEDSFELVTGEWIIEIWYGDQKLGMQRFNIIDQNSECEHECQGF